MKYVRQAVLMPKELLPKSTVLKYMVRMSSLLNIISSLMATIHSLAFMMSNLTPGILPSSPPEYCVRTRNRFLASCWVMVLAPRALPEAMSFMAAKSPCMSMPWCR